MSSYSLWEWKNKISFEETDLIWVSDWIVGTNVLLVPHHSSTTLCRNYTVSSQILLNHLVARRTRLRHTSNCGKSSASCHTVPIESALILPERLSSRTINSTSSREYFQLWSLKHTKNFLFLEPSFFFKLPVGTWNIHRMIAANDYRKKRIHPSNRWPQ